MYPRRDSEGTGAAATMQEREITARMAVSFMLNVFLLVLFNAARVSKVFGMRHGEALAVSLKSENPVGTDLGRQYQTPI